jgi:enamine deaminase RidA (YjgF/YER057c/UK114 family)
MQNIQTALSACGATFETLIKLSICIIEGQDIYNAFQISQKFMSKASNPPVVSVMIIPG